MLLVSLKMEPHRPTRVRSVRHNVATALAIFLTSTAVLAASGCLSIQDAAEHVGEVKCVTGKVLRVKVGARGVHFLDFCQDHAACPFSVVVFASDLKDIGDVRRLAGRTIQIRGPVKLYDGHAEIILNHTSQVIGGSTLIPPLPKDYDVERQGHYSAGRLHPSKKLKKPKPTVSPTAVFGNESDAEDHPQ